MKELVEFIVKSLVDHPDEVQVVEVPGHSATVIELSVSRADMGRIIGKGGRVINAIRSLLDVQAARLGQRVSLEIIEDPR